MAPHPGPSPAHLTGTLTHASLTLSEVMLTQESPAPKLNIPHLATHIEACNLRGLLVVHVGKLLPKPASSGCDGVAARISLV